MSQRCYYAITTFTDTNTVLEREREMWPPASRDGNVSGESNGESIQEEAVVQIGAKNYLETIQVQYITLQYSTVHRYKVIKNHQSPQHAKTTLINSKYKKTFSGKL